MVVTLLFFDGCPNWQTTNAYLERLSAEFGFDLDRHQVETDEDAQRLQFRGSPTVLIDGRDMFATGDEREGLLLAEKSKERPDRTNPLTLKSR